MVCVDQVLWKCPVEAQWPHGSVRCSTALGATYLQISCLVCLPSTTSTTTVTSSWPQLCGEDHLNGSVIVHFAYDIEITRR